MNNIKCNYCRLLLDTNNFSKNNKNQFYKTCNDCRIIKKEKREQNKCEHNRQKAHCKNCGGSQICEHNKQKALCINCGGSEICEHKKQKSICKECGGKQICEHQRQKGQCIECGGKQICEHNKRKAICKECGGSQICEHNKRKTHCIECGGSQICEHKKQKSICKECGGSQICEHKKQKTHCIKCGGGGLCEHKKQRSHCIKCGGSSLCEHKKLKSVCKVCDPLGHLSHIVRVNVRHSLKNNKKLSSQNYLGCNIKELKMHIENQFLEGMTWENYGEWHIDHIIPLKYQNPTLEEIIERLHFSNTQPLWASDNMSKSNRFIG